VKVGYSPSEMKKKKVLLLTYGSRDHGSSRVSGINHFVRFKDVFDVTWLPRTGIHKRGNLKEKLVFAFQKQYFSLLQILAIIFRRFDIVYVQVMFLPEFCLKILKKKGTVLCYNVDDAIYLYDTRKFDAMMHYADKITVSTPVMKEHLAKYNKDIEFIYSPVDTDLITPDPVPHDVFTIGWIGSPYTALYVESLENVFQALAAKHPIKLLIVGANIKMEGVDVECIDWSEESELEALKRIDIGIMPLFHTEMAVMKGGYKLFLYMAAGKPIISSPVGVNASIVREGVNGYLADNDVQWFAAFSKLQNEEALRFQLGKNARLDAENYYSYNVCSSKLLRFLLN
jgi:glycosyltransferase involved in cell wall biosynthesis